MAKNSPTNSSRHLTELWMVDQWTNNSSTLLTFRRLLGGPARCM